MWYRISVVTPRPLCVPLHMLQAKLQAAYLKFLEEAARYYERLVRGSKVWTRVKDLRTMPRGRRLGSGGFESIALTRPCVHALTN